MKKNLVIVGTSASSKIARFYFDRDTEYKVCAFAVQTAYLKASMLDGLPVVALETLKETHPPSQYDCFVAIGYSKLNSVREALYHAVKKDGYKLPNYISPQCTFRTEENIGDNNLILEDNTIQPFVKIGSNNVLWSGNHIGHDVVIGENNFISSHVVISGNVAIENNCFLGVNSTFHNDIRIRSKCIIAAGAIVSEDTNEEDIIVPARSTKLNKKSSEINF